MLFYGTIQPMQKIAKGEPDDDADDDDDDDNTNSKNGLPFK